MFLLLLTCCNTVCSLYPLLFVISFAFWFYTYRPTLLHRRTFVDSSPHIVDRPGAHVSLFPWIIGRIIINYHFYFKYNKIRQQKSKHVHNMYMYIIMYMGINWIELFCLDYSDIWHSFLSKQANCTFIFLLSVDWITFLQKGLGSDKLYEKSEQ